MSEGGEAEETEKEQEESVRISSFFRNECPELGLGLGRMATHPPLSLILRLFQVVPDIIGP